MQELPDNILVAIFQLIDPIQRLQLHSVCRRWNNLMGLSWSDVEFLDQVTVSHLNILIPKCGKYLKKLQVDGQGPKSDIENDLLEFLAAYNCPKLKQLELNNFLCTDVGSFISEVGRFSGLQWLAVDFCSAQQLLPNIATGSQNSVLMCSTGVKLKGLKAVTRTRDMLTFVQSFAETQELKEFQLFSVSESADSPDRLLVDPSKLICQNYLALRKLVLTGVNLLKSDFARFCQRAVNVEIVIFLETNIVQEAEHQSPSDMISLGLLRNLTHLQIEGCWCVDGDAAMRLISLNCKKLKTLSIRNCVLDVTFRPITESFVLSLASFEQLENLELARHPYIHDWALTTLFCKLNALETVCLCQCRYLSGTFLAMLVNRNSRLKWICLNECENVDISAIEMCIPFLEERPRPLTIFLGGTSVSMAAMIARRQLHNLPLNFRFDSCFAHSSKIRFGPERL